MRHVRAVTFLLLAATLSPAGSLDSAQKRLVLAGSSTLQPLAETAAQRYQELHPGSVIDVQGGGSSVGISSVRTGLADIGMVSRSLKPDEKDLTATLVAWDGIALLVHQENPLTQITRRQVVDIYTGKLTRWSQLGWADAPITVINKEEGRATLELFEKYFDLKDKFLRNAVIIGPNGQAIASVAGNRHAIAYVSIGSAAAAEQEGTRIKRLSLDGVAATPANVKNGSYGLKRELVLVTRGAPAGLAKSFVEFLLGPEGQAMARQEDFVPAAEPSQKAATGRP